MAVLCVGQVRVTETRRQHDGTKSGSVARVLTLEVSRVRDDGGEFLELFERGRHLTKSMRRDGTS